MLRCGLIKTINQFKLYFFLVAALIIPASAQNQLAILASDIKSGPTIYLTPEADAYYSKQGMPVQPSSIDKDAAMRSFRSAVKLGDMGSGAMAAVPVLIESFPKAIHVTEVKGAVYAGEGTFDDWVSTYVMSEKNKFLLASPFLDYNSMMVCEPFIESSYQPEFIEKKIGAAGIIKSAVVNITIIFTYNFGTCALSRITGQSFGKDRDAWKSWWGQVGGVGISTSQVDADTPISSGTSFNDILVRGKYRMSLSSGDELVGIVDSKSDTSLIFETIGGKPYSFSKDLIVRYDLLEAPKAVTKKNIVIQADVAQTREISYDDLIKYTGPEKFFEVHLTNGSVFKGKIVTIDEGVLKLEIEGSVVPISKEVITRINFVPPEKKEPKSQEQSMMQGPFDTVIVINTQSDDWGTPKPDLIYSGKIIEEKSDKLIVMLMDGSKKEISRSQVRRLSKNSEEGYDETIKRYARQLICPQDMFVVDLPPGKQGRPFFKVCVDKYEYPNRQEVVPTGNVSYKMAQNYCEQQGKRLCTAQEWQWACSGLEGYTYPYGWNLEEQRCNTDVKRIEASGSRVNCVSKFGGYDMTGNIFEWVTGNNSEPVLMGGPFSKCQTQSPGVGGSAKAQTGLRCCKSN
jgi:hypothetical protein